MKKLRRGIALAAVAAAPFAAVTAASPARADGIRECEPWEVTCQCGYTLDTSQGIKNAKLVPNQC